MRVLLFLILISAAVFGCSSSQKAATQTEPDWKTRSNKLAEEFTLSNADRYPEGASGQGYRQYDKKTTQLENDMETLDLAHTNEWQSKIAEMIETEKDPEMLTDLRVFLAKIDQFREGQELTVSTGEIAYCGFSKGMMMSLQSLINDQSPPERKAAAVDRFDSYINGFDRFKPYAEACVERTHYLQKKYGKKSYYPLRSEVTEYLEQSKDFVVGVKQLLEKSGRADWTANYEKFKKQVAMNDASIRKDILPNTRTSYRLPKDTYAYLLKVRGIDVGPEELIRMAKADYARLYPKFVEAAAKLAKKHQLKDASPAAVIRYLKKDQITDASKAGELYENANTKLTQIIQDNNIITLPKIPLRIRVAGDIESKAAPVPHVRTPPFIQNTGQRPEFVVPTSSTGKLQMDDFSYRAAALILTAHEGRPGHDLQFSSMLDQGLTVIRATFAWNNVNIEGWGLYAEDLVFPYIDEESQFAGMQLRLMRVVRGFLDPQVQLGLADKKKVLKVYTQDLGISKTMAELEFRRFTYDNPGQAPSYFFGLNKLLKIKADVKTALGPAFQEKCFNDAVMGFGLLPLDLIGERLKTLKCDL